VTEHARCANCAQLLPLVPAAAYCPACGQETRLAPPTFAGFLKEFAGQYLAVEGTVWRSLAMLIARPGSLTLAYLEGRRRRYVPPLRLYLTASFLFFLVVKLLGVGDMLNFRIAAGVDEQGRPIPVEQPGAVEAARAAASACVAGARPCGVLERLGAPVLLRATEPARLQAGSFPQRMADAMPYAVFLMLPLFAGLVALVERRRGMPYGAHFVFSLHVHAFGYLALLLEALLPDGAAGVSLPIIAAYGAWALHRVYAGRLVADLLRAALIATLYGLALALGTVALTIAVLMWP
jgi:hypothetical protein